MLQFYAADLARAPDGRWWVLADRTESASGAGFALENRIALSRMLPDVFAAVPRRAARPVFHRRQGAARRLAPQHDDEPRIVLLSQAAGSINYFEDAFLARYLGYTLAEAGDLAVRRNRVYLKRLAGLSPVNVLVRRPNSEHLDPLEIADAGAQGTAGLVASRPAPATWRSPTRPAAAWSNRRSFARSCRDWPKCCSASRSQMPGVATWWCGEPKVLDYVLERLDELIVMPAYRRRGEPLSQISQLAEMSRDGTGRAHQSDPAGFVAQERIVRSGARRGRATSFSRPTSRCARSPSRKTTATP